MTQSPSRGQPRQFAEFLKQRRPHGVYGGREYWNDVPLPLGSMIRDPMYDYIQMKVGKTLYSQSIVAITERRLV